MKKRAAPHPPRAGDPPAAKGWPGDRRALEPMLATLADARLVSARLVYEPKYDGVRTIVEIDAPPAGARPKVRLWSRRGNAKDDQFPEVVAELERVGVALGRPLVLDGEIVALDDGEVPASFLQLQGRIHLTRRADIDRAQRAQPVAFYAFDLLRDGDHDLRGLPLTERRKRLEACLTPHVSATLRLTEQVAGDARAMHARATAEGWEGLIAKEASSRYDSGRRSPAWRKIKLTRRQEFIVAGWTDPRGGRSRFGALLLGVRDGTRLVHVGQVGSGFTETELGRLGCALDALATDECPFDPPMRVSKARHWVTPRLVVEVKFTEWTGDGQLRHPVYLGLRDDVDAEAVTREPLGTRTRVSGPAPSRGARPARATAPPPFTVEPDVQRVIDQLQALEDRKKDGTIQLPETDHRLAVTNLHKVFWPELKITKGDLLRYYARVSSLILPAVADRPLVMKRFPDGIRGNAFYQQRRVREAPPPGVRVEPLPVGINPIGEDSGAQPDRFVGGSLLTLLYMAQMAAISQDPWFSKVGALEYADQVAIDLDPMEGVPFARVLDVARWVRDELATLDAPSFPKTSGSRGIHIYIPLPPKTRYESGMLFCQIVATIVAGKHPRIATVTRSVARRGKTVYVDYLQNILGKTLAMAYSVRASDYAGVSTPLTWLEVDEGVDPRDFTIRSVPARFLDVGDLWAGLRTSPPADPRRALEYT